MKCIALSGKSIHSIEDQLNFFLEENKVDILNIAISTTEGSYPGTKLFCAIVVYEAVAE